MSRSETTIAASATGAERSGISIIRVSGPSAFTATLALAPRLNLSLHRRAQNLDMKHKDGRTIDHGLAIVFPGPHSYTGEDLVELHCHGNPLIVELVLSRLNQEGVEQALPGEFTERAFLNGKMDLTQAEAVADVINAETTTQLKAAQTSMSGVFSKQVQQLQNALELIRAHQEASIDFSDQAISPDESKALLQQLSLLTEDTKRLKTDCERSLRCQSGVNIALIGPPNAGKSTLLNQLAQEDLAIVTSIPGTTRDSIACRIEYAGIQLNITDTAGLRTTQDDIEKIGIQKSLEKAQQADIVWLVVDASIGGCFDTTAFLQAYNISQDTPVMVLANKADKKVLVDLKASHAVFSISAKHGQGIEPVLKETLKILNWTSGSQSMVYFARKRHLGALCSAVKHAETALEASDTPEIFAEELRLFQRQLSILTGEYSHDQLLDQVFRSFCLGK